jgi:plasmid stability protein
MPTLVLRNVPDELYQQLKVSAAQHRRSMTQEAIVSLQTALDAMGGQPDPPTVEETLDWLQREVWSLPVLDHRDEADILGYNEYGAFD